MSKKALIAVAISVVVLGVLTACTILLAVIAWSLESVISFLGVGAATLRYWVVLALLAAEVAFVSLTVALWNSKREFRVEFCVTAPCLACAVTGFSAFIGEWKLAISFPDFTMIVAVFGLVIAVMSLVSISIRSAIAGFKGRRSHPMVPKSDRSSTTARTSRH